MAINIDIYSNANAVTKTITVDFFADLLSDYTTIPAVDLVYYFKLSTSARDTSNLTYGPRIVKALSDLALNKAKQSASNTAAAYTTIDAMVQDYVFDYITGHVTNQYNSGVEVKAPMKFT